MSLAHSVREYQRLGGFENEVQKLLSEGFLRGMQIRVALCQQKSVTQPLVAQASKI